jgi:transposase-like protein
MLKNPTTCSQNVVTIFTCKFCQGSTIKFGKSQAGKTRYRCKNCLKTMLQDYTYKACEKEINFQIILLTKEGCGIRSTARILHISPKTVLRRIIKIARSIERPYPILKGKSYEVDEIFTYIQNKDNRICITYSLEDILMNKHL